MALEQPLGQSGITTAADRLTKGKRKDALHRHVRIREDLIRYSLFACGILSIFTTLAIVYVLASDGIQFFTRRGFLNTNQELSAGLSAEDTILRVNGTGSPLSVDMVIRIGREEEALIVRQIDDLTFEVVRGYEDTPIEPHPEGTTIFYGKQATIGEFLTGTNWQPQIAEFGVLPLITSTLTTSVIALLIAGPIGLGAAIYLSEYAPSRLRTTLKPILELLAGIPTVVYGYFALTFMTPILQAIFNSPGLLNPNGDQRIGTYNMLSAGLVMGIMIIPTIASISEDSLSAVPRSLREASYGMGATKRETVFRVLLPAALSGIIAAFILGISRAVGETMIVLIAAGAGPRFTINPFEAAETMTGHIARISTGDLSFGSIDYNAIFAIGLTLFIMTFLLNIISNIIRNRFREVYE